LFLADMLAHTRTLTYSIFP